MEKPAKTTNLSNSLFFIMIGNIILLLIVIIIIQLLLNLFILPLIPIKDVYIVISITVNLFLDIFTICRVISTIKLHNKKQQEIIDSYSEGTTKLELPTKNKTNQSF